MFFKKLFGLLKRISVGQFLQVTLCSALFVLFLAAPHGHGLGAFVCFVYNSTVYIVYGIHLLLLIRIMSELPPFFGTRQGFLVKVWLPQSRDSCPRLYSSWLWFCFFWFCTPATCRWGTSRICTDATHSPQLAQRVCISLKGKRIPRLALACCCLEFTFVQSCLLPSYGEGYSGGLLVMVFILKWVNEMSQLLSVGGRRFSISRAMPGSSNAHW